MKRIAHELIRLACQMESARLIKAGRSMYFPAGATKTEPKGTDLEIYYFDAKDGKPAAVGFSGRKGKPDFRYQWPTEGKRDDYVKRYVDNRKKQLKEKMERREERKKFKHKLKVDDILSASWGYDQTNVNFYRVFKTTDKSVVVREVMLKVVKSTDDADYVVPIKNKFVSGSKELQRRVDRHGGVWIDKIRYAKKWSGNPLYQTGPYAGH